MSIRKRQDGSNKPWICECYPTGRAGKRVRKRFTTKGEALAYEKYVMREVDDKPWLGNKPDHRRLSELLEVWWQVHGHTVKTGKLAYDAISKTIERLGDPIATTFSATQYLSYRAGRHNNSYKSGLVALSPVTHNIELAYLKSLFNRLIKYKQWNQPNPLAEIDPIRVSQRELGYIEKEDIEPFLAKLRSYEKTCFKVSIPQIVLIAKICLATGARISEARTLKVSQVSKYKLTFTDTKGKKNRSVPISENLHNEIMKMKVNQTTVFDTSYKDAWRYIKRALPEYIPNGQATHALRHTFATYFMINKGDILVLQRILGHQKIQQTMGYAHFSPDHLIQAVSMNPLEN